MRYREFGNTGIKVSEVGFGCWAIGGNEHGNSYGTTDDRASLEAVQAAVELGCNFFDTADVYGFGHSEELLGRALKSQREKVVIATKAGADFYSGSRRQNFSADYVRRALDRSLDRLQTDYVDIYQLHNPPLGLLEKSETYTVMKELKKQGKIRAWGVSIFDPIEGLVALRVGQPDCLQVVYNIFSTRAAESLFPKSREAGCAIISREPLANGFLSGKYGSEATFEAGDIRAAWPPSYVRARALAADRLRAVLAGEHSTLAQASIKFVLAQPAVAVVIPGMKTAAQAEENLAASDGEALSEAQLLRIAELASRNFDLR